MPYPDRLSDFDRVLDGMSSGLGSTSFLSTSNEIVILVVEIFAGEVGCFENGLIVFSSSRSTLTWVGGTASPVTLSETADKSKLTSDPIGNPTRYCQRTGNG